MIPLVKASAKPSASDLVMGAPILSGFKLRDFHSKDIGAPTHQSIKNGDCMNSNEPHAAQSQEDANRGGRPVGEVRKALLKAVDELATDDKAPTLQELAQHACVGMKSARMTIQNLKRCGALAIARPRRVPYRNRPVAEYAPTSRIQSAQHGFDFSALTHAW